MKTIELTSGLQVDFYDESIKVAADRYMVRLRFCMNIPVSEDKVSSLGPSVNFEQIRERIFVSADQKEIVLQTLLDTCISHATQYMGHPDFVPKYLEKLLSEKLRP